MSEAGAADWWVDALQRAHPDAVAVSARARSGVPELRAAVVSRLRALERNR